MNPWFPHFHRPGFLTALACGLAVVLASPMAAQTATIGSVPVADQNNTNTVFASLTSSTGYILPFKITSIGSYSLDNVQLLLSGNANLSDFSLLVSSTYPTDLTTPTSLTTFTASGLLTSTPTAYTFTSSSGTTLSSTTTYYLRVLYTGTSTANWIATSGTFLGQANYSGSVPPLQSSSLPGQQVIYFRSVTSSGFTDSDLNGSAIGVSITGSAVPEPSTYALIAGAIVLAAVGVRQWRRRALAQA